MGQFRSSDPHLDSCAYNRRDAPQSRHNYISQEKSLCAYLISILTPKSNTVTIFCMKVSPRMYGKASVAEIPVAHRPCAFLTSDRIMLLGSVQSVVPPSVMPSKGAVVPVQGTNQAP